MKILKVLVIPVCLSINPPKKLLFPAQQVATRRQNQGEGKAIVRVSVSPHYIFAYLQCRITKCCGNESIVMIWQLSDDHAMIG